MLCDECGKNKATVHLTEIINDQVTKLNLCEGCAKSKGTEAEQHFGIADLLAALSDAEVKPAGPAGAGGTGAPVKNKCAQCGLTYEDFKKTGRLGCGECYTAFKTNLTALLKKIHGATQHICKTPGEEPPKEIKNITGAKYHEELQETKTGLQNAIKKEEFEEAAALRDKIKFLEKKIKESRDEK